MVENETASSVQELAFAVAALQYIPTNTMTGVDEVSRRLERSRERNREHARRTRLRKKAQMQALQTRFKTLQAERASLQQKLQDRHIASLLLTLSSGKQHEEQQVVSVTPDPTTPKRTGQRKPLVLSLVIDGKTVAFGTKSNINWKTGIYTDELGRRQGLSQAQLEQLRYVHRTSRSTLLTFS